MPFKGSPEASLKRGAVVVGNPCRRLTPLSAALCIVVDINV